MHKIVDCRAISRLLAGMSGGAVSAGAGAGATGRKGVELPQGTNTFRLRSVRRRACTTGTDHPLAGIPLALRASKTSNLRQEVDMSYVYVPQIELGRLGKAI